jgi:D-lactate dehydrogenase
MRIAVFDTHRYDRDALEATNRRFGHELAFLEPRLTRETAPLAEGFPAVCSFVNDRLDRPALEVLAAEGVRLVLLRSAGYNHVDLEAARRLGLRVTRVPEYSPHAVAEHAFALLLSLDRKIHRAYFRVRDANFTLDGLVGFDLHGKTFGVMGTGRIGAAVARIAHGFGCRVLAFDLKPDPVLQREAAVTYVEPETLYAESDVISLHVPLTPKTYHLIGQEALRRLKRGAYLINTGRGALIDTPALVEALKAGRLGGACLDVYEEEEGLFFQDLSGQVLQDDVLARLLTFPNVLVTSHQAFLTREALAAIAETTLDAATRFERGQALPNEIGPERVRPKPAERAPAPSVGPPGPAAEARGEAVEEAGEGEAPAPMP